MNFKHLNSYIFPTVYDVGGHVEIMSNNIVAWTGGWEIVPEFVTRFAPFYLIFPSRKWGFPTSEL